MHIQSNVKGCCIIHLYHLKSNPDATLISIYSRNLIPSSFFLAKIFEGVQLRLTAYVIRKFFVTFTMLSFVNLSDENSKNHQSFLELIIFSSRKSHKIIFYNFLFSSTSFGLTPRILT